MLFIRLLLVVACFIVAACFLLVRMKKGHSGVEYCGLLGGLWFGVLIWLTAATIHGLFLAIRPDDFSALTWWCSVNVLLAGSLARLRFALRAISVLTWLAGAISCLLFFSSVLSLVAPSLLSRGLSADLTLVSSALSGMVYAVAALVLTPSIIVRRDNKHRDHTGSGTA